MIDVIKNMPEIKIKIVEDGKIFDTSSTEIGKNKRIIIFGVPGAFTPTCSEQHFPGYIKLYKEIISKGIDDIYCLSVNDKYVMKSWLISYSEENKIIGIADGNAEIVNHFKLISDKTKNHMGIRSERFAMVINNNTVLKLQIESTGELNVSSAENILKNLD